MRTITFEEYNSLLNKDTLVKFTNCGLKLGSEIVFKNLYIRNGKILNSQTIFFDEKRNPDIIIDCNKLVISPGFIDIQVNGAYGRDFSDPNQNINESLTIVSKKLVQYGITAFCPTIITSANETYKKILSCPIDKIEDGASNLGYHLEGPFLSEGKSGMHNKKHLGAVTEDPKQEIQTLIKVYGDHMDKIRMVTLAPEIEGSDRLIKYLVSNNIVVSLGHSEASYEQGSRALHFGATMLTHLYCAMNPFHHRDPHLIGLLTQATHEKPLYYGLITDLVHTHETAIRIAQRANPDGLIVVTDSNVALGLEDGNYQFGSVDIELKNGISYVSGTKTLAGATTPLDKCLRNYWLASGLEIADALSAVTERPANAVNVGDKKGYLLPNYDADLVLLWSRDPGLKVILTIINGKIVFVNQLQMLSNGIKIYVP